MVRKIIEHTLGEISNRRELSIDFTGQHRTHGTHRTHRTTSNHIEHIERIEQHRTHRTHQNDRAEFNTRLIPRNYAQNQGDAISGDRKFENFRGCMPPDPPRGGAPPALGFTFTITIHIWNPPIQKSWLRRCIGIIKLSCFYFAISYLLAKSTPTKIENCAVFGSLLLSRLLAFLFIVCI